MNKLTKFEKEELTGYLKNALWNWRWDRTPLYAKKLALSLI
jgi:hypothetical protein